MGEALLRRSDDGFNAVAPSAGYAAGEVLQMPDGSAAYVEAQKAAVSGDPVSLRRCGQVELPKTASLVVLKGGRVYWDRSANTATPLQAYGGNDFYLGTAVEDSAASDTTVTVELNAKQCSLVDLDHGEWDSVVVLTAGTPALESIGPTHKITFSATAEAQKVDLISVNGVLPSVGFIWEAKIAIYDIGDNAALDINFGVANATHASDADAITESVFFHLDGNSLNILAESDDDDTEVAATDTTVDAVDDTYALYQIDARDPTDIKLYINGVRVLSGSTFTLANATGPMKALLHVEKASDNTTADVRCGYMSLRPTDLAS